MGKLVARMKEQERMSEGTRMVFATNWKSREILHMQRLSISMSERRKERTRAKGSARNEKERQNGMERGISSVR